jgi:hypothetical protein
MLRRCIRQNRCSRYRTRPTFASFDRIRLPFSFISGMGGKLRMSSHTKSITTPACANAVPLPHRWDRCCAVPGGTRFPFRTPTLLRRWAITCRRFAAAASRGRPLVTVLLKTACSFRDHPQPLPSVRTGGCWCEARNCGGNFLQQRTQRVHGNPQSAARKPIHICEVHANDFAL